MRTAMSIDRLLVEAPAPDSAELVSRVGGAPLVPRGAGWPSCRMCGLEMPFVLQVRLRDLGGVHPKLAAVDGLLSVWRCGYDECAFDPPECGTSFATVMALAELVPLAPPAGLALPCFGLDTRPIARPRNGARAADPFPRLLRETQRVVGLVSREPCWIDDPFELDCTTCRRSMVPLLQLHLGVDVGYALFCDGCCEVAWIRQRDRDAAN